MTPVSVRAAVSLATNRLRRARRHRARTGVASWQRALGFFVDRRGALVEQPGLGQFRAPEITVEAFALRPHFPQRAFAQYVVALRLRSGNALQNSGQTRVQRSDALALLGRAGTLDQGGEIIVVDLGLGELRIEAAQLFGQLPAPRGELLLHPP